MCGSSRSRSSGKSSYSQSSAGAVDVAGGRARLVGAEQQAASFFAHVPGPVRLPEHAHLRQATGMAGLDLRVRLGDDVLVLDREHGNIEPPPSPPVRRAKLPVALTTCSQVTAPASVSTRHSPLERASMPDHGGVAVDVSAPPGPRPRRPAPGSGRQAGCSRPRGWTMAPTRPSGLHSGQRSPSPRPG